MSDCDLLQKLDATEPATMIRSGCREPLAFVIADVVEHVARPRRVSLIRDVWGYRIITTTESANDCRFCRTLQS